MDGARSNLEHEGVIRVWPVATGGGEGRPPLGSSLAGHREKRVDLSRACPGTAHLSIRLAPEVRRIPGHIALFTLSSEVLKEFTVGIVLGERLWIKVMLGNNAAFSFHPKFRKTA